MNLMYYLQFWRSLKNQKMNSLIKIGGLALGIAACMLIALFIRDELNYDNFYPDANRIFRVVGEYKLNGNIEKGVDFPPPFANALKENFPEVEQVGRINRNELFGAGSNEIRRTDEVQNTFEQGFAYADQQILDIFHIPMIYGDRSLALAEPKTIVISKRKANKYFPGKNPVGKTMIVNNDINKTYRIGGVMENFPSNSHLNYDFLITLSGLAFYPGEQTNWMTDNYHTYVKVHAGTNMKAFEKKLSLITTKYYVPVLKQNGNVYADKAEDLISYKLQPVHDIHLKSDRIEDSLSHGDIRLVQVFILIAAFVLLIACINFINLSTAKVSDKAREIGLRKTIGARRISLINNLITESVLYSFLSFVLGLLLALLLLPFFNSLSSKSLVLPFNEWWLIPLLVIAALVVGVLAGIYPSLYLSGFKPIHALKKSFNLPNKKFKNRNALVIFQFASTIILIIGTFGIYRQMSFILNKKLGYDKEQVLLLHGTNTLGDKISAFKDELLKVPGVKTASISGFIPIEGTQRDGNSFWNDGRKNTDESVNCQIWRIDYDYINTLGMKIVEGRNFSKDMPTDGDAIIINQTMAKKLGLKDPIGKRVINFSSKVWTIIGIVEDFHFESIRNNIGGLCLVLGNSPQIVSVKISSSRLSETIRSVTGVWKEFSPNQPIRYTFLDENYAMMYADVKRTGRILSTFALFSIIIACLGLFALSSGMIEKRTKEIGVRKVNGARVTEILTMLNKDFIKWVAIAFVIACPVAWYAMNKWLQNFAYKTTLSWWVFVLAGIMAIIVAVLTVSWQSWRAATRNPVESLRYE